MSAGCFRRSEEEAATGERLLRVLINGKKYILRLEGRGVDDSAVVFNSQTFWNNRDTSSFFKQILTESFFSPCEAVIFHIF